MGLGDSVAWSPTAASPAPRAAPASATSPRRPPRAGHRPGAATATPSPSTSTRARLELGRRRRRGCAPSATAGGRWGGPYDSRWLRRYRAWPGDANSAATCCRAPARHPAESRRPRRTPTSTEQQPCKGGDAVILTGAQIVWECLVREGVDVVFGYPGGASCPPTTRCSTTRSATCWCATSRARPTWPTATRAPAARSGVAIATSGPGATNLTTGIATAMLDSVPTVFITGQVPSKVLGSDAFQETDVTGITLPITKHNELVTDVREHRARAPRGLRASPAAAGRGRCWWTSARTRSRRRSTSSGPRTSTSPADERVRAPAREDLRRGARPDRAVPSGR